VSTEARGQVVKSQLKAAAGSLAQSIKKDIGGNTDSSIRSVEINTKTLAAIVDSVVKEPVKEPVAGSAIVGIVILCVILVAAAILVAWYYKRAHNKKMVCNTNLPKTNLAAASMLKEHEEHLFPSVHGGKVPGVRSFYNRNYYGD